MIKVMIVDDQPVVINELTHLIEDSWTARVVDTAVDGKAAIPSALKNARTSSCWMCHYPT